MTDDRDRFLQLMSDFGVSVSREDEDEFIYELRAKVGGNLGYNGFVCSWEFDKEGNFKEMGVWQD